MGHRDDRDRDAGQPADLRGEHAAGVDDDVGRDRLARAVAELDVDAGHAAALDADRRRRGCGSGSSTPRWRAPAASAMASPDGSSQPSVGSQTAPRTPSVDISGKRSRASSARDQLERQPERLRPAGLALELLEARRRRRQPERADLVPRRVDAGLVAQAPVQRRRRTSSSWSGSRSSRSWPTRPAEWNVEPGRELGPVDEDDVGPAALGEVVGDRRPADAAADDHRPGMVRHAVSLSTGSRPSSARASVSGRARCRSRRPRPSTGRNCQS